MSEEDPLVGYLLANRWRIDHFMAEEQLGRLYSAVEERSGLQVCIKVLHPHLTDDPEVAGRFEREMVATASMEGHPNTVQMMDFGEHRVFRYIVLEFLYANSLYDEIQQSPNRQLPWERAMHITAQIASALTVAHAQGIVHRNLNSGNILLLKDAAGDYVKVRDFGLSWIDDQGGSAHDGKLTAYGSRVGDTTYMAPEYITDERVDPRGDLYAIGVLLHEMLTGEPPFTGKSATIIATKHISEPPPRAQDVADVPDWVQQLLDQLLAKDPNHRPGSATELAAYIGARMGRDMGPPKRISLAEAQEREMAKQAQAAATSGPEAQVLGMAPNVFAGAMAVLAVVGIVGILLVLTLLM